MRSVDLNDHPRMQEGILREDIESKNIGMRQVRLRMGKI